MTATPNQSLLDELYQIERITGDRNELWRAVAVVATANPAIALRFQSTRPVGGSLSVGR
jgi:hypothetical protein